MKYKFKQYLFNNILDKILLVLFMFSSKFLYPQASNGYRWNGEWWEFLLFIFMVSPIFLLILLAVLTPLHTFYLYILEKLEIRKNKKTWDRLPQSEKDKIIKREEDKESEKIKNEKLSKEIKKREQEEKPEKSVYNLIKQRNKERIEKIKPYFDNELSILTISNIENMDVKTFDKFYETHKISYEKKIQKEKEEIEKQKLLELQKKEEERILRLKQAEIEKDKQIKDAIRRELLEKERLKKLKSDVINELIEEGKLIDDYSSSNKRESIPSDIKLYVWERDKGRCVNCGINQNLEFDHIIPISKGGANTLKNLQLLCLKCNRQKSNKII